MSPNWQRLLDLAQTEVKATIRALPEKLRTRAEHLPVTCEFQPNPSLIADGIEPDTLGLFVGEPMFAGTEGGLPLPAQVILFLANIWEEAEENETSYRREIRVTLLHELGHYLGLDEDDLSERGLE